MHTLASSLSLIVFFIVHIAALCLIPLGLPGTFIQLAACILLAAFSNKMPWKWVLIFLALTLIGELVDFLSGQWGAKKFGGSRKAAWGALLGGLIGAFIGVPIPIVGSIIGAFLGTFIGAVVGEMYHQQEIQLNLRVGIGAVIGRAIGVGAKLAIGIIILFLSAFAIIRAA